MKMIYKGLELLTKDLETTESTGSSTQAHMVIREKAAESTLGFGGSNTENVRLRRWGDQCDPSDN